jgi:hypothetical protein
MYTAHSGRDKKNQRDIVGYTSMFDLPVCLHNINGAATLGRMKRINANSPSMHIA